MLIVGKTDADEKAPCAQLERIVNSNPTRLPGHRNVKQLHADYCAARSHADSELAWMSYMGIEDEEKKRQLTLESQARRKYGFDYRYINNGFSSC
jgi:hypothetical protein